jgi:hypothetical protein
MNDGTNALVLETNLGASTATYELLNVWPSEIGPQEFIVQPPGADGFPSDKPAILLDGGPVTDQRSFRCQGGRYPGGGDQATIVEMAALLSRDQTTYTVTETILAHGPRARFPELIVVSQTARQVPLDQFDPSRDVPGVPCWGTASSS